MVLGVSAPQFPFDAFLQHSKENQPKWDELAGLVPDTLAQIMQAKKQQQWKTVIEKMMADPNVPQGVKQYAPLLAGNPDLAAKVLPSLIHYSGNKSGGATMDFDPGTGTWSMPAPPTSSPPAPPMTPPPAGGAPSPAPSGGLPPTPPPPPSKPPIHLDMSTPGGRAMASILDRQGRGKLNKEKADASMIQAQARKELADLAVVREVSRTMNPALAPSGTALGKVAFTNIRSGRNIQTLGKGPVTWAQVSNALSDIAGAYHGGAPFAQEYMNQGFPNINQDIAKWTTFVTGQPQRNVPEPIRLELVRMSQALLDLDNSVLKQNAKSQGKILGGVASPEQIKQGTQATEGFIKSSSGGGGQSGLTPEEQAEFQRLDAKWGGR